MSGDEREIRDVEQRLKEFFSAEAGCAKPSPGMWERLSANLGEQRRPRRLMGLPVALPTTWRSRGYAVAVTACVALAAALLAVFWPFGNSLAPGQAVAQAYEKLQAVETVRYTHEGQQGGGMISARYERLTEEDKQKNNIGSDVDFGVVLESQLRPWPFVAEGTYDIAGHSYHTRTTMPLSQGIPRTSGTLPGTETSEESFEHIYADGDLYSKRDGAWELTGPKAEWDLFVASTGRTDAYRIPAPGLEVLTQGLEGYQRMPDTELDGVEVRHYRNEVAELLSDAQASQVIEVWVDKRNGLPVKVFIESRRGLPEDWASETLTTADGQETNVIESLMQSWPDYWKAAPMVVRQGPTESVVSSTFHFFDFNEPVDIRPPVTGQLAFVSDRQGGWHLYKTGGWCASTYDTNSCGQILLSTTEADDSKPYWSSDAKLIAFLAEPGSGSGGGYGEPMAVFDLYVTSRGGHGRALLAQNVVGAFDRVAAWSHDSKRVAFISDKEGDMDIYVVEIEGKLVTRLTDSPGWDMQPDWSPDGSKIAFVSYRNDEQADIYVMDADGSDVRRLTDSPGTDTMPLWSPDGSKLLFLSDRGGNTDVWMMDPDGSNQVDLSNTLGNEKEAVWSPDGRKIAFTLDGEDGAQLLVMDVDGSNRVSLESQAKDIDWSPDGLWIAFSAPGYGRLADIYAIQPDGQYLTRLTEGPGSDRYPSWFPLPPESASTTR